MTDATVNKIGLQKFWDMLNRHDWYYEYSDDGRVWEEGREAEDKLKAVARLSPAHGELFAAFKAHKYKPEEHPRPDRPEK